MIFSALLFFGPAVVPPAAAQEIQSSFCTEVLASVPPVSRYVERVLQRADAGLAVANSDPTGGGGILYFPDWAQDIASALAKTVDVDLRLVEQERDLRERTACEHLDLLMIECKIDQVRSELNTAIRDQSIGKILRLSSLINFLNNRYRHLAFGSRIFGYEDPTWGEHEIFDPNPVMCCIEGDQGCSTLTAAECRNQQGGSFYSLKSCVRKCPQPGLIAYDGLCPYSSDYLPPNPDGYGCDLSAMNPRAIAILSLTVERDGLQVLENQISDFRTEASSILGLQDEIALLLGEIEKLPDSPDPISHYRFEGCPKGWCKGLPSRECGSSNDCTGVDIATCIISTDGPATQELRGPFSVERNEERLMHAFRNRRENEGSNREHQDLLKFANEFPSSKANESSERSLAGELENGSRQYLRLFFNLWNEEQGYAEGPLFAIGSDPFLQLTYVLQPLRKEIQRLSILASRMDGVRRFAVDFAYFLRRSCMYRPCNLRLEQILRILFTDECFPYVNGSYTSDTCENPRWDKCINASEVSVELPPKNCPPPEE
jgi:hypothetical protein